MEIKRRLSVAITILIFSLTFAIASHVITLSDTTTSTSVNESVSHLYNITINNSDSGQPANITQVNITLPSSFTFTSGSNSIENGDADASFTNTSTLLSWSNLTYYIINGTSITQFLFNATASTPGSFNITVTTLNSTTASTSNISITVNDTLAPSSVEFASPTPESGANSSTSYILYNVSVTDTGTLDTITFYLFNSTSDQINTTTSSTSPLSGNISSLTDGTYYINATANDTAGNSNNSATRTIILDTSGPAISLTKSSSSTQTQLVLDISTSDSGTGITGTCADDRSAGTVSGTGGTQTFTETGLRCGASYTIQITCTDYAGNSAVSSITTSTSACSSGGSSSSRPSLSPGITSVTWSNTFIDDDMELSTKAAVNRQFAAKERTKLKIGGETHHIGIVSLTSTSAVVQITSTPQEVTMNVGESMKFELTDDNFYDVMVVLNSISNNEADLTINSINEEISQDTTPPADTTPPVTPPADKGIDESSPWKIILIVVVALLICGAIWFYFSKKKS